jgi:hypothetical protein
MYHDAKYLSHYTSFVFIDKEKCLFKLPVDEASNLD